MSLLWGSACTHGPSLCAPAVGRGVPLPWVEVSPCPASVGQGVPVSPYHRVPVSLIVGRDVPMLSLGQVSHCHGSGCPCVPTPVLGSTPHTCALPSPACLCPPRCAAPRPPARGVGQSCPAAPRPPARPGTGLQQQQDPGGAGRELRYGEGHLSAVTANPRGCQESLSRGHVPISDKGRLFLRAFDCQVPGCVLVLSPAWAQLQHPG